ncbi:lysostaphin resistance A-like protein [Flavobacterium sp.]|uniref:lysostaphin resistance A-like protein n=1 Tax=Flavobacterium sp. TaxID=239 RepID=UPI004048920E
MENIRLNLLKRFFIYYLISIFNIIIFNYIVYVYEINSGFKDISDSLIEKFVLFVLFVPIIETLVLNYLPQKIIKKFTTNNWLIISICSLIFGLMHFYSPIYFIYGIIAGIILNNYYLQTNIKTGERNAFWLTSLLHAIHNLTGFIYLEFLIK